MRRAVLVLAVLLLAGCAAGPPAQYLRPQGDGATVRVGPLVVTNALVAADGAGAVAVRAVVVNEGDAADRLVGLASPAATGGEITGDATVPPRGALTTGFDPGAVPPPGWVPVGLRLTGAAGAPSPGLTYPVDLTFARAGTVHLRLRVADPGGSPG